MSAAPAAGAGFDLDHTSFAVRDALEWGRRLRSELGAVPIIGEGLAEFRYLLMYVGTATEGARIELLDPAGDGFLTRFLDDHGEGPHHITFTVPDLRATVEKVRAGRGLQRRTSRRSLRTALAKGARLHAGGVVGDAPAAYFAPAVLTGVGPQMRAYREELFGPVAVVYSVESEDQAIRLANDSDYGLGAAVFSTDSARAERVAASLDVGMTNVNTGAGEGAELPLGGVKRSGFGRELGPLGMDEFVNK